MLPVPAETDGESVQRVMDELRRRFAGVGCVARPREYAGLLNDAAGELVLEALRRLADEGVAELECLADGSLVFHFPRR